MLRRISTTLMIFAAFGIQAETIFSPEEEVSQDTESVEVLQSVDPALEKVRIVRQPYSAWFFDRYYAYMAPGQTFTREQLLQHSQVTTSHDGAYSHRKEGWNFWADAGFSMVQQDLNISSLVNGPQSDLDHWDVNLGLGAKYNMWQARLNYRQSVTVTTSDTDELKPLWIDIDFGRNFDLAYFATTRMTVTPLAGLAYYRNTKKLGFGHLYTIESMRPTVGARVAFVFNPRFDMGVEGHFFLLDDGPDKMIIKADAKYWMDRTWALGLRYRMEDLDVSPGDEVDVATGGTSNDPFTEQNSAFELFARFLF